MGMYKITIDTRGQSKKEKQEEKINTVTGNNNPSDKDKNKEGTLKALKNAVGVQAATMIGKTATNLAINYVSTSGIRTDNMARQNEITNMLTVVNNANGMASTTINAAVTGTTIGGAGGAVLAAALIAVDMANRAYQAYQNIKEYNREVTEDRLNSEHASERLGIICTDNNR